MTQGPDYGTFKVGQVLQPVPSPGTNSSLQDCDSAVFYTLDFLTYVIRTYPGARIVAEASAAQVLTPGNTAITDAVECAYPYEPAQEYLSNQFSFPALFIWRTQGQTEQWTVGSDHDICGINVAYVLPPLSAAQSERMLPLLKAVFDTIRRKVNDAWDPGYTPPGGSLGQQFNGPGFANLEEIGFGKPIDSRVAGVSTGYEYGRLSGTGDLWFPALMMKGYIIEQDQYAPTANGPSKFAGADITGNLKADDGTVVLATSSTVVQASTQQAPTIVSLDTVTGPASGGTTVNITGTLFLTGPPMVFFGLPDAPQYAASVAFNSSTSLTITTPQMLGPGVVDLTVSNRDGQRVTLAKAFTFT